MRPSMITTHGRALIEAVLKMEPAYATPVARREFWRRVDGMDGTADIPEQEQKRCIDIGQAARRLMCCRASVRRYVIAGRLKGVYTATGTRKLRGVTAESLDAFLADN